MSKRSALRDYAEYFAARLLVCVVQALSFRVACAFARFLAWLAYHIDKRHRLVAKDNLRQAFPGEYSEEEIDDLVRRCYLHFCVMIMEMIHLPRRVHPNNWSRFIDVSPALKVLDGMLAGRPPLMVTGHYGNWEVAGYMLGLLGFRTYAIARPLDNPHLDRFIRRFREHTGQRILAKHGEFELIQQVLAEGHALATLGDQDAGPRGLFVDFFGRPASTHKAIALLAIEHNVPMIVAVGRRVGEKYRIDVSDLIDPADYANDPNAVRAITQRFTTALENLIRPAPEQYLWLHRRWKHQPVVKVKKAKAA